MMEGAGRWCGLAAFCALLGWGPAIAEEPKKCDLRAVMAAEMQTIPDGRVTIPVQFEGHDYRLMVDTGGYINTVSAQGGEAGRLPPARQPTPRCAAWATS